MGLFSNRSAATKAAPASPRGHVTDLALSRQLSTVYATTQHAGHLFASPLGPFDAHGHSCQLPRFVYFGRHVAEDAQRIAFYSGFDARDSRGARSLLHFVERLATDAEIGKGLNLYFFPVVDALGSFHGVNGRELGSRLWTKRGPVEIDLLEKDVRTRGYHGFVRVESALPGEDELTVRVRGLSRSSVERENVDLISSEDTEPLSARFVADSPRQTVTEGPLSVADDLPFAPFEITLSLPLSWSDAAHRAAVCTVLGRFVRRYRGLQAYAQHL